MGVNMFVMSKYIWHTNINDMDGMQDWLDKSGIVD